MNLYSSSAPAAPDSDRTVGEQGARERPEPRPRTSFASPSRVFPIMRSSRWILTGSITFWNVGAEHLFGWRSEQAVRVHVSSLLGPGGRDAGIGTTDLEEAKRQGSVTATRRLNHRDGSTRDARTTILALRTETGVLGYGVAAHLPPLTASRRSWLGRARRRRHDVTAETRRQLSESRTLLAAEIADRTQAETSRARLLRRLVVAQEDERRRLARDLHDGLGQRLTALRLILEALDGRSARRTTDRDCERPGDAGAYRSRRRLHCLGAQTGGAGRTRAGEGARDLCQRVVAPRRRPSGVPREAGQSAAICS